MQSRVRAMAFGGAMLGLLLGAQSALAITAGELKDPRPVCHHFTTAIRTGLRVLGTKDPSKGRFVVIKVSATVPKDDTVVFGSDFTLVYTHANGREDRARLDAIAKADSAKPGDYGRFIGGEEPRLEVDSGLRHFGLAFWIEPDVQSLEIHVLNGKPMTYRVGSDRMCSVFLTTNADPSVLPQVKKLLEAGGVRVVGLSQGLTKGTTGITIHYADKMESQARELSQRLMMKFKKSPTLKKMKLVSEVDIVVWLGK